MCGRTGQEVFLLWLFYVLSFFRPIVISMGEGDANTSCPGRFRGSGWPSRGRWAVLRTGEMFARRNEDDTF